MHIFFNILFAYYPSFPKYDKRAMRGRYTLFRTLLIKILTAMFHKPEGYPPYTPQQRPLSAVLTEREMRKGQESNESRPGLEQ